MEKSGEADELNETPTRIRKRVLNAGSGAYAARRLHPTFARGVWQEIRIDIDPQAKPDVVSSITDMRPSVASRSFDAVWSSHALEHLYPHEVPLALAEFKRVLKPDGFTLVTLPDLEAVASLILDHGLDHVAYTAPVGPITPLDMLFGHTASVSRGQHYMAHKTGFTCSALGQRFVDAGFPVVLVKRAGFDLWALGLMQEADQACVQRLLVTAGLDMSENAN